jgi:hypothetical protein
VVETGHSSEVFSWDAWGVVLADHSVSVSGVSDDNGLASAFSVVVDGLSGINKDLTIVLKQVSTFHTRSTGLSTNQEVVVNFFESSAEVTSDNDVIKEGEGTIMEFSLNTLKYFLSEGEIEQVEDNSLILTEEFTTKLEKL